MTNEEYNDMIKVIEIQKGKLYSVTEISHIMKKRHQTILYYLKILNINTIRIKGCQSGRPKHLVPERDMLRILAIYGSGLALLKWFENEGHGNDTVSDALRCVKDSLKETEQFFKRKLYTGFPFYIIRKKNTGYNRKAGEYATKSTNRKSPVALSAALCVDEVALRKGV